MKKVVEVEPEGSRHRVQGPNRGVLGLRTNQVKPHKLKLYDRSAWFSTLLVSGSTPANAVRSAAFLCRYVLIGGERSLNRFVSPIISDLQSGASLGAILEMSHPDEQTDPFLRIWVTCNQEKEASNFDRPPQSVASKPEARSVYKRKWVSPAFRA